MENKQNYNHGPARKDPRIKRRRHSGNNQFTKRKVGGNGCTIAAVTSDTSCGSIWHDLQMNNINIDTTVTSCYTRGTVWMFEIGSCQKY